MSADQIRLIVDSLNDAPFNLSINIISFDNFSNEKLLQTLSDVLCWVNDVKNIDIRNEAADQTAMRVLHSLKILKFKPPTDIEQLDEWRAGIVEGSKSAVYPVLFYLFNNIDMLKQRAYLARFLVKVDVPPEFQDPDLHQMQAEIAELMEQFKTVHSQSMDMTGDMIHLDGIKGDLKNMEAEKEQLTRRIERIEAKVKNMPNIEKGLEFAAMCRTQKDRYMTMEAQKQEMRPWMIKHEKKIKRLEGQLEELQRTAENLDPSGLIEELEAEIQTNSYLADEKLLREINQKRPIVAELTRIVQGPAIDESTIQRLQQEIDMKNDSIRHMMEERERREEDHDENFSIYRHQTATVERKKAAIAQKLQDARQELEHIESQIADKKKELRDRAGGEEVVTTVQFRNYVSKMRLKTAEFKKKKQIIEEMKAENLILGKTAATLSAQWNELKEKIVDMGGDVTEINIEVPVMANRPKTAAPRTNDVDELKSMVKELNQQLANRSDQLAPLRKTHAQKTEEFNVLVDTLRESKKDYERRKAALETGFTAIKEEVEELENRRRKTEEKLNAVKEKLDIARAQRDRLERERRGEVRPIVEELEEAIRQAQDDYDEMEKRSGSEMNLDQARKQKAMWVGMLNLFEAKMRNFEEKDFNSSQPLGDRVSRMS